MVLFKRRMRKALTFFIINGMKNLFYFFNIDVFNALSLSSQPQSL